MKETLLRMKEEALAALAAPDADLEALRIRYLGKKGELTAVLRGMGKAIVSTVISLVGACLMRVVWLWTVFPAKPTLEVIFVSYPISWLLTTATAFIMIRILLKKMIRAQESQETACGE
jgi:hypothetical protein